ncbi:DoxX family membrane protein [Patescibacteria group bacterium]
MLSLFPELFTYQQIAPLLLRLALAVIFLSSGYHKVKAQKLKIKSIGTIEFSCGAMLVLGFLTQISAILAILITTTTILKVNKRIGFLILACALSLLLLGPGIFSIDLPF